MQLISNDITTEDQEVNTFDDEHTSSNPYCSDVSCWCHGDSDYHEIVIHPVATEEEQVQARSFFGI